MIVTQDPKKGFAVPRTHPYVAIRKGEAGFVDFKLNPERIAEVLEDFVPHGHVPAIQTFFRFLAWINGPESILETCDCALQKPQRHKFKESKHLLSTHGRLMLMHRDLQANCDDRFNTLYNTLGSTLSSLDQEFPESQGNVCFAGSKALFNDLIPNKRLKLGKQISRFGDPGRGWQLMIQFKAFGDHENEAFNHLDRVFKNIELACRQTSEKLRG